MDAVSRSFSPLFFPFWTAPNLGLLYRFSYRRAYPAGQIAGAKSICSYKSNFSLPA